MIDRLSELHAQVQQTRLRLGDLADRAARSSSRLQADSTLVNTLDQLTKAAAARGAPSGQSEGEDGHLISDAWEIALINEEGR